MKNIYLILIILVVTALFPFQVPAQDTDIFRQEGIASWYGREFEGRPTASGEIFNASQLTAAHPNLPFGTIIVVTNLHNNKSVTVRVNDRGPFVPARIVDISRAAAERIDMITTGTAPVKIESVDRIVLRSNTNPIVGAQVTPQITAPVTSTAPAVSVLPSAPAVTVTPAAPVSQIVMPPVLTAPILTPSLTSAIVPPVVIQPVVPAPSATVQPVVIPVPIPVRLIPSVNIDSGKSYRLQVGSFKVAKHAVDAFDRLKSAGLSPSYERFIDSGNAEFYRVLLSGIRGSDVPSVSEKIGSAGFREALIKEEN